MLIEFFPLKIEIILKDLLVLKLKTDQLILESEPLDRFSRDLKF